MQISFLTSTQNNPTYNGINICLNADFMTTDFGNFIFIFFNLKSFAPQTLYDYLKFLYCDCFII